MNVDLFDDSPGRVWKLTGPNSVASPGVPPRFRVLPTQWNVAVYERGRSRVIGRVFLNRDGRYSALGDDQPSADVKDYTSHRSAIAAVKRDYLRRKGL